MQFSPTLFRQLLLDVEKRTLNESGLFDFRAYEPEFSSDLVTYHLCLLKDADFIDAYVAKTELGHVIHVNVFRLTMRGHTHLDLIRNESKWADVTKLIGSKGLEVGLATISQALGAILPTWFQ